MVVRKGEYFDNCFDAMPWFANLEGDDLEEPRKGEILKAGKTPVNIYESMGGRVRRVVKPGFQIGSILGSNSARNWFYISDTYNQDGEPGFVSVNSDLVYVKRNPNFKGLTDQQKKDVILGTMAASSPGGAALATTYKAGEAVVNALPDFSSIVKVIIGVFILVLLIVIFK